MHQIRKIFIKTQKPLYFNVTPKYTWSLKTCHRCISSEIVMCDRCAVMQSFGCLMLITLHNYVAFRHIAIVRTKMLWKYEKGLCVLVVQTSTSSYSVEWIAFLVHSAFNICDTDRHRSIFAASLTVSSVLFSTETFLSNFQRRVSVAVSYGELDT